MNFRRLAFLLTALFFYTSCGVVNRSTIPLEQKPAPNPSGPVIAFTPVKTNVGTIAGFKDEKKVKASLEQAYKDWQGVPYVLGGSGYGGVDCSSFMQIVFEDYFSKQLPRNTRQQFGVGEKVNKAQIRTADLVFFKTGAKSFHVGVMINEAEFMHASTSSGVMISSLQNNYWQQVYYTARRVL